MRILKASMPKETCEAINTAIDKGEDWYTSHVEHVDKLIVAATADNKVTVIPHGSDLQNPALWKDIHWLWFMRVRYDRFEPSEQQ